MIQSKNILLWERTFFLETDSIRFKKLEYISIWEIVNTVDGDKKLSKKYLKNLWQPKVYLNKEFLNHRPQNSRRGKRLKIKENGLGKVLSYLSHLKGVCSIFLRVDRSINEIHKLTALFSTKVFYKKYVFINYWHFLCSHLFYKVGQFLLKYIFVRNRPFSENML